MTACAMRSSVLLLSLLLLGASVSADTMTITLDNVEVDTCDTPWTEGIFDLQVIDTDIGDYTPPGNCVWFPQAEGVALMGARLEIDTTALLGVDEVQIDLREDSGDGHTKIFLYEPGGVAYFQFVMSYYSGSATEQSMPIVTGGFVLGKIVISGNDALIQEVRVLGNLTVENEEESWGTLKSRW